MYKLFCIISIVVWIKETVSATVLFYQDFSPHKVADFFSLPGGETEEGDESHKEEGQTQLTANGGGCWVRGGVVIAADHTGTFLSSQSLLHSNWSRFIQAALWLVVSISLQKPALIFPSTHAIMP